MSAPLPEGQVYKTRRPGVKPVTFDIEVEAVAIIERFASGKKAYGQFIARLCYEHVARLEERQRLRQALGGVLAEEAALAE